MTTHNAPIYANLDSTNLDSADFFAESLASKDSALLKSKDSANLAKETLLESYDYALPENLIANTPIYPKSKAKLLVYDRARDSITHTHFSEFFNFVPKDCLIVLNDTKVLKARIFGFKQSANKIKNKNAENPENAESSESRENGKKIEIFYHNFSDSKTSLCNVQIRGKIKEGDIIVFKGTRDFVVDFKDSKDSARDSRISKDSARDSAIDATNYTSDTNQTNTTNATDCVIAKVISKLNNGLRVVEFSKNGKILDKNGVLRLLESIGVVPLPPYIKRDSNKNDELDYQSVFARNLGAIAAPTASLHFDEADFRRICALNHCFITLHVGAGTFFSVESSDISEHKMHSEAFFISQDSKNKLDSAKKVLCIGTTAARCVEFYARNAQDSGMCDIFINPLNKPIKTNHLLTNFHLPKSTLIMLVAGFIGLEKTLEIYKIAIEKNYRFYSYGDGMLIL